MIWGLGGFEEDHQLHHCCWTGRVGEREDDEEEEEEERRRVKWPVAHSLPLLPYLRLTFNSRTTMVTQFHAG